MSNGLPVLFGARSDGKSRFEGERRQSRQTAAAVAGAAVAKGRREVPRPVRSRAKLLSSALLSRDFRIGLSFEERDVCIVEF